MKQITLSQGQIAIVDDQDFEELSKYNWFPQKGCNTVYAVRNSTVNGKAKTISMHRHVLGITDGNTHCDHINGNGIDNRRENLRPCTRSENHKNKVLYKSNATGFKGVSLHKVTGRFQSSICVDGTQKYLGLYENAISAAHAYDEAAKQLHGEFARLNFPQP